MTNLILIITGKADAAILLQDVLATAEDGPFDIERVTSLAEALGRLDNERVDIILVDLTLPDRQCIEIFD